MGNALATCSLLGFIWLAAYSQGFRVVNTADFDYLTQLTMWGRE